MKRHTVNVDGRKMVVFDGSEAGANVTDAAPHSHYCVGRSDVHREVAAFKEVCAQVGRVNSVLELFGGSGWHSAQIQKLCAPSVHQVWDYSADCVRSIRASLPEVQASQGDSYTRTLPVADWVHCDFNNYTPVKRRDDKRVASLVERVFQSAGRFVTITDSAVFGLIRFKQNRDCYARMFGVELEGNWRTYFTGVGASVSSEFGFGLRHVIVWGGMASMGLYERGADPKFTVSEPKGKISVNLISTETVDE